MKKIHTVILVIAVSCCTLSFQKKPKFDLEASKARGKDVYTTYCISCHMEQGEGLEGVYPPLAKSDYMLANRKRAIQQILNGVSGEIKVNGKIYNGEMIGFDLTDEQVSDLMNYIYNSFGNKAGVVPPAEIKAARKK